MMYRVNYIDYTGHEIQGKWSSYEEAQQREIDLRREGFKEIWLETDYFVR